MKDTIKILFFLFISSHLISEEDSNLIKSNPFAPPSKKIITPNKNLVDPQKNKGVLQKYLQYRGIVIINGKKQFSIFNQRTNKPFWLSEGQSKDGYRVINYDSETNSVIISNGLVTESLTLITPSDKAITVPSANIPINKTQTNNKKGNVAIVPKLPNANKTNNKNNNSEKNLQRRRLVPKKDQ